MIRLKNIGNAKGAYQTNGPWKTGKYNEAATTYRFENTELNKLNSSWENPMGKFIPDVKVFVFM